jgi:hypothetical protein
VGNIPGVQAPEIPDTRVTAQSGMQLAISYIDAGERSCPALQQTICKPARRSTDIQGMNIRHVDGKFFKKSLQFFPPRLTNFGADSTCSIVSEEII